MTALVSAEVLAHFGVQIVSPLGGRLNQHWLVEGQGERLVLRRWSSALDDVAYEVRLMAALAARGWPVAAVIAEPIPLDGHIWSLAPFLPGEPPAVLNPADAQRARGRLLAAFHADLAQLEGFDQRAGWRRCEAILADTTLDQLLADNERAQPEEIGILRWHLERARLRATALALHTRTGLLIHGDFTPWNLRFHDGRLSGILDFELAHWDHRVAEFALAWRGVYDAVIAGYSEVSPLEPEEWAALTPIWWAWLIEGACHDLRRGIRADGWTRKMLLRRSPLMGPDAAPFR
jgi:aminoglycoside phosphotransferase (APT) family kinase protein